MVSKRSNHAVKFLLKYLHYHKNISINMTVHPTLHDITISSDSEQCTVRVNDKSWCRNVQYSQQTFKGLQYTWVDEGERSVTTCWDNADDVIQMFYMHIHDLFGQPLTTLAYISGDNAHVDLLDAIFNNQRNIENGSIGGFFALPENDATCVMEYFQNARNLNLCSTLFGYDLSKFKFHHIFIDDGEELSYQKLMELDFVALDLYQRRDSDNSLQNEQLNSLLRLWLTGFLPRMKNFRLETTAPLMLTNILEKIDFELSERQL